VSPCFVAFCEERAFPAVVRGPVLCPGAGRNGAWVAVAVEDSNADAAGVMDGVGVRPVAEVVFFRKGFGKRGGMSSLARNRRRAASAASTSLALNGRLGSVT